MIDSESATPTPLELSGMNRRARVWLVIVVACFVGLGARLVYIQARLSPKLTAYRTDQQTRTDLALARRGSIYDTHGRLLAGSSTKPSIYADPQVLENIDDAVDQLSAILDLPADELGRGIKSRKDKRFVWLARKVSQSQADAVRALRIRGLVILDEPFRFYPSGSSLAQVIGFVNDDSQGLEGLELQFNEVLAGRQGTNESWCDARRRPLRIKTDSSAPPRDGRHLVLTVDLVIQEFLQEALQQATETFRAESAVGIVMSPNSGDVLAMACHAAFDLNHYWEYAIEQRRNRCVTDPVEPGSCFKPLMMSAALADGVVNLDEVVDCGSGVWYFGKRRIRDTHPNGRLTFEQVLVKSSNIGMGQLGTRMGNARLHHYVRAFGFGGRTGIELPGESPGIVLPLQYWTSYSKTSVPIGQELAVTPIQLITAFSALVNGGIWRQPRIVRAVLDPAGREIGGLLTERTTRQVVQPHISEAIAQRALVRMVNESHHNIKLARHQALGKTGTAQVPYRDRRGYEPDAYLSSYLGAAPARDPVVAVLVMVTKPNKALGYYGGKVAGPAVKDIIEKTLAYWDVPPDERDPAQVAMLRSDAMN